MDLTLCPKSNKYQKIIAIRTTNRRQNTYDESAPKQIFPSCGTLNTCTPEPSSTAVGLDPGQGGSGKTGDGRSDGLEVDPKPTRC